MNADEFQRIVAPIAISNKKFNKIFCIGYNKTGTTSIEAALRLYGYRLPRQHEQEIRLSKQSFNTNYNAMKEFCKNYDAFQDMPFSQGLNFVAADALFPNSKFILTERDPESWYNSLVTFHEKVFKSDLETHLKNKEFVEKINYLYPGYFFENTKRLLTSYRTGEKQILWDKLYDKDYYIEAYLNRNDAIKKYFSETEDKLLVINIATEKTTKKLCEFLGIPEKYSINMPHQNKT